MGRTPSKHRLGVFDGGAADGFHYLDPIASARVHFLLALREVEPRIVEDLRQIARVEDRKHDDASRLADWAKRWSLSDEWCLAYARATVQLYGEHYTSPKTLCWNLDLGGSGALVSDER